MPLSKASPRSFSCSVFHSFISLCCRHRLFSRLIVYLCQRNKRFLVTNAIESRSRVRRCSDSHHRWWDSHRLEPWWSNQSTMALIGVIYMPCKSTMVWPQCYVMAINWWVVMVGGRQACSLQDKRTVTTPGPSSFFLPPFKRNDRNPQNSRLAPNIKPKVEKIY